MSAIKINEVCEDFIRRRAIRHLEKGRIALFAAGTGNPFFTTDSAAALRAIEIGADLLLKATKVDGVYTADPKQDAERQALRAPELRRRHPAQLQVMDTSAIALCRDNKMPLRIYDMSRGRRSCMRIGRSGEHIGTRASAERHGRLDPAAILAGPIDRQPPMLNDIKKDAQTRMQRASMRSSTSCSACAPAARRRR